MNQLTNWDEIRKYFPVHSKATIKTFMILLTALIQMRTVNLYKLKDRLGLLTGKSGVSGNAHYKRLLRFFGIPQIDEFCEGIFLLLLAMCGTGSDYLVMDRTNWKIGKKNINVLTLGILLGPCFVPLCWRQLDKKGNSNTSERKEIVGRFLRLWQQAGKKLEGLILVADREFIGYQWLEYLKTAGVSFIFRLRENMYFELQDYTKAKKKRSLKSFNKLIERYGVYAIRMELNGKPYCIVMTKNPKYDPKEPYVYFISDLPDARKILKDYMKRWSIECCFKHLKTNGFNLEAMNLKNDMKIELMMGVVATAYMIAVREGLIAHRHKPITVKQYKNGKQYLEVSIFRRGVELIDSFIATLQSLTCHICQLVLQPPQCLAGVELRKNVQ